MEVKFSKQTSIHFCTTPYMDEADHITAMPLNPRLHIPGIRFADGRKAPVHKKRVQPFQAAPA
ncbi:MAG TPA: hypothetical protein VIU41_06870, partial [Geobacteraceae bacterium]